MGLYFLISFIGFVIAIIFTRIVFSIPSFLRKQNAIIELLAEMAIKNGGDRDKIENIVDQSKKGLL